ncbi:MAG: hypothetical protein ACXVEE_15200 [Polyangiales bacterium]
MRRTSPVVFAVVLSLASLSAVPARAIEKEACVQASDSAQKNKNAKKLRAAKKDLLVCVQDGCPAVVKKDCDGWLSEVEASLPTIVLSAKDGSGNDVFDVKVTLDGEPLTEKLDGSAIAIDPGPHTIHWEAPGVPPQDSKILVKEAEKNRTVSVTLGATPPPPPAPAPVLPPPPAPAKAGPPAAAWILGGIGIAGVAGFAYFGLSGRSDVQHLKDTCAPYCDKSDEDPARRKLIAADVALGVGIVSVGLATYVFVSGSSHEPSPKPTALRVDATPVAGGATFQLMGRF